MSRISKQTARSNRLPGEAIVLCPLLLKADSQKNRLDEEFFNTLGY
jgi:hypothetical protein